MRYPLMTYNRYIILSVSAFDWHECNAFVYDACHGRKTYAPFYCTLSTFTFNILYVNECYGYGKALRSLEAIGLVKTYVKHENDITQYIYRLYTPLSLKAFFKNQILSSLLQLSLSEEDFQKTVQYFKISLENLRWL